MSPFAAVGRSLCLLTLLGYGAGANAADAGRGAYLYMRADSGANSCVSCHGPDPGLNRNNLLSAADRPTALTKALINIGAMGYLQSELTELDAADVSAFLGGVARLQASPSFQVWPITIDQGRVPLGSTSAVASVRIRNAAGAAPVSLADIRASDPRALVTHDCPTMLAAAASCDVKVHLAPTGAGMSRTSVAISASAWSSSLHIPVVGVGEVDPTSALRWDVAATPVRFDAPASAPVVQTLRLTNPGPMPATLGLTSIVGPEASRFQILAGCPSGLVLQAGTSCELSVSYTPDLRPLVEATVQVRSDQGNPDSLLLQGSSVLKSAPEQSTEAAPVADAGGGCSVGPPGRRLVDPLLPLLALLALAAAAARGRRR